MIIISLVESFYLIYMFYFYYTNIDFNIIPHNWFDNIPLLNHLKGNTKGLRICLFGRYILPFFIAYLILRNYIGSLEIYWRYIIFISFILSLLNMNAFVYLTPVWLIEIYNKIEYK